jgi:purine-binding chemotaxis protein CheW
MVNDDQKKMKIRAGMISGRETETKSSGESLLVVEFLLSTEKYAIDAAFVTEVLSFRNMTPVPQAPHFVVGLMNIRGRILSIVNLMSYLDRKEAGTTAQNKIIILKHEQMEFGIVVDEILGTTYLDMTLLGTLPGKKYGSGANYIHGVTPDGVILLNTVSILSDNKIIINQK